MVEDTATPLYEAGIPGLRLLHRGKVRDLFEVDTERMLIVASDRISAFDVVLPTPIPGKGEVLTAISNLWFERTRHLVPNHLEPWDAAALPAEADALRQRSVLARRLQPLPIEAIVRGYLIGTGWRDYQAHQAVSGVPLPAGLRLADRLPEPIFTPSTKAAVGEHDINIDYEQMSQLVGREVAAQVRDISLRIFELASAVAGERGIIIADTKLEFALDESGRLVLIDELLTPDSSRFWPAEDYRPGTSPPSFDKQYVRDYLESLAWDKQPPGPELPAAVVAGTAQRYREALRRLAD